jgi:hypothetical protein
VGGWETALEAREGKPGHGTLPAPQRRRGTRDRQAEKDGDRERPPDVVGESDPAEDSERGNASDRGKDVTGQMEAEHLQAKVEALVERLKQQRYRATRVRRRDIPKGNGHERP